MQLYSFLVLIVSLGCGSLPPVDVSLWQSATASFGLIAGWTLLGHMAARVCAIQVRSDNLDPIAGAEVLEKQLGIFRWLGLGVILFCLGGFGLATAIASIPIVESSTFLQAALLLTPGLALIAGTWSAEHLYGYLMDYTESGLRHYFGSIWNMFRSGIGWLLIPVLGLLAINDGVALLPISQQASNGITAILILALIVVGVPLLIQRLFKTSPLCESQANWIGEIMTAAGVGRTRAVRWETGGQTFNALVAGFVPPLRTLLVSDRLLDQLPRDQVAMVVLHEAAHLRRRHMLLRMMAILPAWGSGALLTRTAGDQSWAMVAGTLFGTLMTVLVLKVVAYRTEFDADVQACRIAASLAGSVDGVPSTYRDAARSLAAGLWRVTAGAPSTRRATWLHPSVIDRIARMEAMAPEVQCQTKPISCQQSVSV